jgi:hypothetical protein
MYFSIQYFIQIVQYYQILKSGYVFETNCRGMIQIVVILILLLKKKESSFDLKRINLQSQIGK